MLAVFQYFFINPSQPSVALTLSDVFRGYSNATMSWNGLKVMFAVFILFFEEIFCSFYFKAFFRSLDIWDLVFLYMEFDDVRDLIGMKLKTIISVPLMKLSQVVKYLITKILMRHSIQNFNLYYSSRPLYFFINNSCS